MQISRNSIWLSLPIWLILLGYVLYPMLQSFGLGFQVVGWSNFFEGATAPNVQALFTSVWLSLLTVFFGAILGVGMAYLLFRFDFPLRGLFQNMATMPLALPPLVGVMAFLFLYGESGVLPRLFQHWLGLSEVPFAFEGFYAVLLVHIYSFYVYFYLFSTTALQDMDGALWEASADLGASSWTTFWRVIFPALRTSIRNASLLVFMLSMASFTAPLLFDGTGRYLTLQIYQYKTAGDMQMAATVSTVLTLICMVFLYFSERFPQTDSRGASKGTTRSVSRLTHWHTKLLLMLFLSALLFFLVMPVLMIVLLSFAEEGSWTVQLLPTQYSLTNYTALLMQPEVGEPIVNSLKMATLATLANIIFGVAAAWTIVKTQTKGIWLMRFLTALPFAIPGTVIALNLILTFNSPSPLSFGQVWVGTVWMLPVAYFIRHIPLVVRATVAGLQRYDDRLTEASFDAGASVLYTFRHIVFPILRPSILAGALLTFITALGEFVSSIMVYVVENRPISVEIFAQLRQFNFGAAAAYSVFLMILVATVSWINASLQKK